MTATMQGFSFRRTVGIALGVATQLLFAVTVVGLYRFLANYRPIASTPSLWRDGMLALFFAVPHSVLRLPRVQKLFCRATGREFFGIFYCAATCASLWIVFWFWQASPVVLWQCTGAAWWMMQIGFHLSWIALAYSLCLTGLGYQTGYTEWCRWFRREPLPRRRFVPRSAYRWIRHPVYLSFLGLLWFNPQVTLDQAVLTVLWTGYIAVGSHLKDERLAYYMGEEYRQYQRRVPGYPLLRSGPLGLRRPAPAAGTRPPGKAQAA